MIAIRELLWQHADLTQALSQAKLEPVVIGWVDDLAIPILATSAQQLTTNIRDITEGVVQIMWDVGLQINLGKGKTECVATFRGSGAPKLRAQHFIGDKGQLPVLLPDRSSNPREGTLHMVGHYTHLGTNFGQAQNFGSEVSRRVGAATTAFRQVAKLQLQRDSNCLKPWCVPG